MKRPFFLILGLLLSGFLNAQEPVKISSQKEDSLRLKLPGLMEPEPVMEDIGIDMPFDINSTTKLVAPVFDFSKYLHSNWTVSYSSLTGSWKTLEYSGFTPGIFSPFPGPFSVFNEATYRINGKFLFGGNSFGANSIFTAPLSHPGAEQWEIRGASIFMEYKVSKNFRIGASVTVSDNPYHP